MGSAQGPLSHRVLVSLARSIVLQPSLGPISPGDIFYYSGTFCFLFPHHMLNLLLRAIFYASFARLRAFEISCNRGCYSFSCVPLSIFVFEAFVPGPFAACSYSYTLSSPRFTSLFTFLCHFPPSTFIVEMLYNIRFAFCSARRSRCHNINRIIYI